MRAALLAAAAAGLALALTACFTRVSGSGSTPGEGRPCASDRDCPQPSNPCQVWTCWQEVCTPVAAAKDTLIPKEAQVDGDCKVLVCDGQGKTASLPDKSDQPPEDDNPCAEEVCEDGAPAYPPLGAGTPCGKSGVCNGKGKCGVCLPAALRCKGNTPEACSEEGAWESKGACPAGAPICSGTSCLAVLEVAAGDGFSCGRLADGKVRCFGDPSNGNLGQSGARRVAGLSGAIQVAAGGEHTCALISDQTVKCWGSNATRQLGDDTKDKRGYPLTVPGIEKAVQIAAGGEFTCALQGGGTVACWGSNENGQLGVGPPTRGTVAILGQIAGQPAAQDHPVEVAGLLGAAQLSLGRAHACARHPDGGVSCWGSDVFLALGRGTPPAPAPAPAKGPKPPKTSAPPSKPIKPLAAVKGLRDVAEIAAGAEHACARLSDGTVACWGKNDHGQLGDGTTKTPAAPVKVKDLAGVVSLALGASHSCARLQDGSVKCWGAGASGQLGDAAKADHALPFAVPGLAGIGALSSGAYHLCAMAADRSHICWGDNQHGELGSGAAGDKPTAIAW